MIKKQFGRELAITGQLSKNNPANSRKDVAKVQCWLNLFALTHPGAGTATTVDGDYGSSTEAAVKNFQRANSMTQTGVVDSAVFAKLSAPMKHAFAAAPNGGNLRERIISIGTSHLNNRPFELVVRGQANSGPWVRSYMDGNEGEPWFWCMGFVQTIVDQAAALQGKDFRSLMPLTYSCDIVGATGLNKGLLVRNAKIRANPSLAKPGDIFLLRRSANDWIHTGIIARINGDVFETIEGNTNTEGSRNGNGVHRRVRNFQKSLLDVFSIQPLVG